MSERPVFWVGNRNPSISDTITVDGAGQDLTTKTVRFRMRKVGSAANDLKVDELASSKDASGNVRYDWAALDVDEAGEFLAWWRVDDGTKTQDVNEALIEFRSHDAGDPPAYVELEQLKSSLQMVGISYADGDLQLARFAASRAIDEMTGRRFWLDPIATTRFYDSRSAKRVIIDDLAVPVTPTDDPVVVVYPYGFALAGGATWAATDYLLEPANARADGRPYESIRIRRTSARYFPTDYDQTVGVTGRFGWAAVPTNIEIATSMLATRLLRRVREAPFGVVTVGIDVGAAMRIAKSDPDVAALLAGYDRKLRFL